MSEMSAAERRLAAILVADVSGYSRLVHADEAATVTRLAALRHEIEDILAGHNGRLVSSAGDGFLADFGSALDAAAAALELQRRVAAAEADIPEAEQIRYRIGLNLGDVLVQEDDLFGDAINVAARLQALAPPGGIFASRAVRDSVRGRFPCSFERVGKRQVKNIARPVTVYRVLPPGAARPLHWAPAAIAATLLVAAVAAALWASLPSHEMPDQPVQPTAGLHQERAPTPTPRPTAPPPPHENDGGASKAAPSTRPAQSVEGTAGDRDPAATATPGGR